MTKFSGFLAAGALALSGVSAMAADLPVRAPAPAPLLAVAPFSWNGFYVGLHAGYGFARGDTVGIHTVGGGGTFAGTIGNVNPRGFVGGGQIGYNIQYGSLVYGIEGDISFSSDSKTATGVINFPPGDPRSIANGRATARAKDDVFGSIRGRLGFAADRFLFYVTGGVGFTQVKYSLATRFPAAGVIVGGPAGTGSSSSTRAAFVLGGGVEYAFTNNWTARVEGLYYDVRKRRVRNTTVGNNDFTIATQSHSVVRAGVNYKF